MSTSPRVNHLAQVQVVFSTTTPVERHGPRPPLGERFLQDGSDRCEARAGAKEDRPFGHCIAVQSKLSGRPSPRQDVTAFNRAHRMVAEKTVRKASHME